MEITAQSNSIAETPGQAAPVTDGDLLRGFLHDQSQAAFAEIVRRHGNMVLGVCRRVTGNPHDAEDAFQAAFLVLARKAASIRPPEMLGHWLYGVAYRSAQKARSIAARRREGERRVAIMNPQSNCVSEDASQVWNDLRPVLDEELNRLPARYRAAIVACDLEGKPRQSASIELGVNAGTLSSRLARGREILARRLARRGVALSAVTLASLIAGNGASAAPASALITTTVQASISMATGGTVAAGVVSAKAAVLSEGVLHAMYITKAKIVATLILGAALTGAGVTAVTQIALAQKAKGPLPENVQGKNKGDGKSNYIPPNLSGPITELAQDGSQITLQVSSGIKNEKGKEPPVSTVVKIGAKTQITFSSIGPLGDKPAQGYQAQVWLEPNSQDQAARIIYSGNQNTKKWGAIDVQGKVTSVSPDGKKITVESTSAPVKGDKGAAIDPVTTTFNLTPTSRITFSGVSTGGAKIQEGYSASIWRDPNTPENVSAVNFSGSGPGAKKGNGEPNVDFNARIAAISADGKTLSLEVPPQTKGAEPGHVDVKLADTTQLIFFGVGPDGAVPAVGQQAAVWMDGAGSVTAKRVRIDASQKDQGADLNGPVLAVSPDGKRITMEIPSKEKGVDPQRVDIDLVGARIVYNNVRQGEAIPTEGYQAQVWLDPQAKGSALMVSFNAGGKEGK